MSVVDRSAIETSSRGPFRHEASGVQIQFGNSDSAVYNFWLHGDI